MGSVEEVRCPCCQKTVRCPRCNGWFVSAKRRTSGGRSALCSPCWKAAKDQYPGRAERGPKPGQMCPCGKPATRRKYCSPECARYWPAKLWTERNAEYAREMRRSYQRKHRKRLTDEARKWRRKPENRAKVNANAARYRARSRANVMARYRDQIDRLSPEARKRLCKQYRQSYLSRKMEMEFALLLGKLAAPTSTA